MTENKAFFEIASEILSYLGVIEGLNQIFKPEIKYERLMHHVYRADKIFLEIIDSEKETVNFSQLNLDKNKSGQFIFSLGYLTIYGDKFLSKKCEEFYAILQEKKPNVFC